MMKERIQIARTLLKESGFFIAAIDAWELYYLGALLDEIFGESNKVGVVTVLHNPKGRNFTKWFSANSEYMLIYAKDSSKSSFMDVALDEDIKATFTMIDEKSGRKYRLEPFMRCRTETLRVNKPNFWYPLYVSADLKIITREKKDGYFEVFPIANNGLEATWINLPETFDEKNELGWFVAKKENGVINIYRKYFEQQVYKNVWLEKKYQSEFNGTNVIKSILAGKRFDYPKSIYLMTDILKLTGNKDSIILDFFAGSGTTFHAVNLLNAEDGGTRKCIMVTNNEISVDEEKELTKKGFKPGDPEWESLGIANYVTWPRTECSIKGVDTNGKKLSGDYLIKNLKGEYISYSDGFETNVKYFKCDWVERKPENYLLSNALCLHVREMIELQNHIEIDNHKNIIIFTKEDYKKYVLGSDSSCIERIWVNQNIIFNLDELKVLKKYKFKYIPKEFFGQELKEVAE